MKLALVQFGNEESYGLLFAATELRKHGEIRFFDAEMSDPTESIVDYAPDYLCMSPMTIFLPDAKRIEAGVRERLPRLLSLYGGCHASNSREELGDITLSGAAYGIDLSQLGRIEGGPTNPANLKQPAREEYFRDIPRMKTRYRKLMMSALGCPFACAYCVSGSQKTPYDLLHRDMEEVFAEARFVKDCSYEIEWMDDDILAGDQDWLMKFYMRWPGEIDLPMYVSTSSVSVLKAPRKLLELMRGSVNCVGLGMQAVRPESLRLINRAWDSEEKVKAAYDRLISFGFAVNLQAIIGLPVNDPVGDALDTIEAMIRIGKGSIPSIYPLQIYPNTKMESICQEMGLKLNPLAGDMATGLPGIDFGEKVNNRLRNLYKLSTMAVKYGIDRDWLESLMDIDLQVSSKSLSLRRYFECIKVRLPDKADHIFASILGGMNLRS